MPSPDSVCICAFGALIKEPLLSAHPMLNVHPSLLPRWRGAAPIERAIEAGDDETGVSIMRPIAEMDAGPICLQRGEPIQPDDDFGSLSRRLAELGGELLVEALDERPEFTSPAGAGRHDRGQDRARGPPSRSRGRGAHELERRVRALNPHVGTYIELPDGERLGVHRARAAIGGLGARGRTGGRRTGGFCSAPPTARSSCSRCRPPGGRAMDAAAYLRGRGAKLGEGSDGPAGPAARIAGPRSRPPLDGSPLRLPRRAARDRRGRLRRPRLHAARPSVHELSPRDRAFAQQLVYGTLQRQATLDYVLTALSARPVEAIDPPLRDALRIGLYQLIYLGSVPDHAAVEQTVELAKLERGGGHRYANAVMRRASREARGLVAELTSDSPSDAAVLHSHPEWLTRMWWETLGRDETLALLERDNEPPESAIRANELIVTRDELRDVLRDLEVDAHAVPELPEGLVLSTPFDVHGSLLFEAGALMPQSRASMLVARVLDPQPGEARARPLRGARREDHSPRGADAGPREARGGGTQRRPLRGARGELPAHGRPVDRRALRGCLAVRSATTTRASTACCSIRPALASAPCRRGQTRAGARTPNRSESSLRLQEDLLESAASHVRAGGTIVYSACTISTAENEERVHSFLARHPDFEADDLAAEMPEYRHPRAPRFLQLMPHIHGTDGFFIARLRRIAEAPA